MGMYDTINGEQVKCFPWASLYEDSVDYHGGDLKYYGTGDEVPYKQPHYNYGRNFVILDLNRFPESDYCCYDYVLHVIVDGKVKDTYKDNIGKINWRNNKTVVSYTGELLNIKNSKDLSEYIKDQREYWSKTDALKNRLHELFAASMKWCCGIALLDNDSEEKKTRINKVKEIHALIDAERERIQPEYEILSKQYSKWFILESELKDVINLGDYISAYVWAKDSNRENEQKKCFDKIKELLNQDSGLYDKYVKWQGDNEYIKQFVE